MTNQPAKTAVELATAFEDTLADIAQNLKMDSDQEWELLHLLQQIPHAPRGQTKEELVVQLNTFTSPAYSKSISKINDAYRRNPGDYLLNVLRQTVSNINVDAWNSFKTIREETLAQLKKINADEITALQKSPAVNAPVAATATVAAPARKRLRMVL